MGKFDGILFCTDLDGTLYDSNHAVSQENADAIRYFQSEGGLFTFVTGRVPMTARSVYELVRPNAPFGCANGAAIYDGENERYLWHVTLPSEALTLLDHVYEQMPEMGIQPNSVSDIYFCRDSLANKRFRDHTGVPLKECHHRDIKEPILKVLFAHEDNEKIDEVVRLLRAHPDSEKYDFIRSEQTLYELLPKGVSKGTVLQKLAERLGVDMKNTVAVGDYDNDLSMIKTAGIGYAVANALPSVKAVADRITVSNDQHAIAAIVEELLHT